MKSVRRKVLATLAAATALVAATGGTALAQGAYPNKPITIVVAYPAGGDVDVLARMFAEKLAPRLKQSVVVENRTGAAGTIGSATRPATRTATPCCWRPTLSPSRRWCSRPRRRQL